MENATKALEMAAGVLTAVLIMSLIAYFFSTARLSPLEEDSRAEAEQLSKFNLEYEVYDKKAMYGADVISCLTKAQSNNEKYVGASTTAAGAGEKDVEGSKFLTGNQYGPKYWINVYVTIKKPLKESLEIYYFDEKTTGFNKQVLLPEGKDLPAVDGVAPNVTMKDIGFVFNKKDGKMYSELKEDSILKTQYIDVDNVSGINVLSVTDKNKLYEVTSDEIKNNKYNYKITPLQLIVNFASTNMKQVITNKGSQESLKQWSSAIWTSALYDFKTRRFKCDEITYSDITGRVNSISFSEI